MTNDKSGRWQETLIGGADGRVTGAIVRRVPAAGDITPPPRSPQPGDRVQVSNLLSPAAMIGTVLEVRGDRALVEAPAGWRASYPLDRLAVVDVPPDPAKPVAGSVCRFCGCTAADCSACVARTGKPCHWVLPDVCSACAERREEAVAALTPELGLQLAEQARSLRDRLRRDDVLIVVPDAGGTLTGSRWMGMPIVEDPAVTEPGVQVTDPWRVIPDVGPRQVDDETVLAVATGQARRSSGTLEALAYFDSAGDITGEPVEPAAVTRQRIALAIRADAAPRWAAAEPRTGRLISHLTGQPMTAGEERHYLDGCHRGMLRAAVIAEQGWVAEPASGASDIPPPPGLELLLRQVAMPDPAEDRAALARTAAWLLAALGVTCAAGHIGPIVPGLRGSGRCLSCGGRP